MSAELAIEVPEGYKAGCIAGLVVAVCAFKPALFLMDNEWVEPCFAEQIEPVMVETK